MKINCISCGHKVDVGDAYDDFCGPVKCCVCGALLEIRTEKGNLKAMGLCSHPPATQADAEPTGG